MSGNKKVPSALHTEVNRLLEDISILSAESRRLPLLSVHATDSSRPQALIRRKYLLIALAIFCVAFYLWHKYLNVTFINQQSRSIDFYKQANENGNHNTLAAWKSPSLVHPLKISPPIEGATPRTSSDTSSTAKLSTSKKPQALRTTKSSEPPDGSTHLYQDNASDVSVTPTRSNSTVLSSTTPSLFSNGTLATPKLETSPTKDANVTRATPKLETSPTMDANVTRNLTETSALNISTTTTFKTAIETQNIGKSSTQEPARNEASLTQPSTV